MLFDAAEPAGSRTARCVQAIKPTVRYWMETEVHVYGFSIAANVLLAFFPFLIVMVSLCRYVLHWPTGESAIHLALSDYFPGQIGGFIRRNLTATVESRGPLQIGSILLLLFTANGIFEPLEVAMNRVWGVTTNRSYLRNQLVSLGLVFACGSLALLSTVLTVWNQNLWRPYFESGSLMFTIANLTAFKLAAVPISILILFLIYWLLPNCKVSPQRILPAAIGVGLMLEALKYVNLLTWPWLRLKLQREYGPFVYSVTIILWSFLASMIILAGAEWAARRSAGQPQEAEPPPESHSIANTSQSGID
ncbi:MAG: YihY/virulence factor BrkB family protein [Bryobacteraceae bacterium]